MTTDLNLNHHIIEPVAEAVAVVEDQVEKRVGMLPETAHKLFLAGLGAVMLAQDEIVKLWESMRSSVEERGRDWRERSESFAHDLIERGDKFQVDRRQRIDEVMQSRREQITRRREEVMQRVNARVDEAAHKLVERVNLPTKDAFEDLNKQLGSLGRKLDKMRREQEKAVAA